MHAREKFVFYQRSCGEQQSYKFESLAFFNIFATYKRFNGGPVSTPLLYFDQE